MPTNDADPPHRDLWLLAGKRPRPSPHAFMHSRGRHRSGVIRSCTSKPRVLVFRAVYLQCDRNGLWRGCVSQQVSGNPNLREIFWAILCMLQLSL